MGRMMFGTQETITCIQDVPFKGPHDESLCLANKISTKFFVAGVYLRDDGYVLKIADQEAFYPMPDAATVSEMQKAGELPDPLPAYSIPAIEYVWGYSLWLVIAIVAVWGVIETRLRRRRRAVDDSIPIETGPPIMATETDRFISNEVAKLLRPAEVVQYQAYALDRPIHGVGSVMVAKGYFVAVTNERLILIQTRIGAFSILRENKGVTEIARDAIASVTRDGDLITIARTDGGAIGLLVRRSRGVSNQQAFLRDVPRVLGSRAA